MNPAVTIFANARAAWQASHAAALHDGLKAHGVESLVMHANGTAHARTRHVACWGWRLGKLLRAQRYEVLVMERGYVGDRFSWTSLGWNGLNGRATFYTKDDPSRFGAHFAHLMRPWKTDGSYVLLIGQVPGDASLGGTDLNRWYEDAAKQARQAYELPVRFRPHPEAIKRGIKQRIAAAESINGTLADALAGAAVCVTFNSNTAVESVLAGVPTVAVDSGTMAHEVTAHRIGERITPDRSAWAARLAWCQWTMDEIRSGAAWEAIRPR
jgi:hypothetical protein